MFSANYPCIRAGGGGGRDPDRESGEFLEKQDAGEYSIRIQTKHRHVLRESAKGRNGGRISGVSTVKMSFFAGETKIFLKKTGKNEKTAYIIVHA